ncbi:MAG: hypothetical protein IT477_07815, partial [Rhodanobacteraceae bacterium]|nr:hypothetical protein [Rhodanobacteraceae bacterium]
MRRALAARGMVGWWRHRARRVAPGAFALVMATGIVSIAAWLEGMTAIGRALFLINKLFYVVLWLLATALWFGLTYAFFVAMTVGHDKPRIEEGLNGSWLLTVVAT